MPTTPTPSPRRRRLLAALVVAASAVAVPLTTGAPAGAATAPLVTTDGIGIRIDENAIIGPVLDDIENSLVPSLKQEVLTGASTHTGVASPSWIDATLDLDLAIDFINAGTTGYPQGGLRLEAEVSNLEIRTYVSSPPSCVVFTRASPLTVVASSRVDATALPAAPFTALPTTNDWPSATVSASTSGPPICSSFLTPPFDWAGFSDPTDPTSTASQFQSDLEGQLVDLLDHLWFDNVESVVGSLTTLAGFGVSYNQIRTDTNGLVATADVDATAGLIVEGWGPLPVTGTQDSGATSNVSTLLAQRGFGSVSTDVIVSLHPNVTNQYLAAFHDYTFGNYGWTPTSSALATALVDPTLGACYDPTEWGVYQEAQAAPYLTPTGSGGRPLMQLPQTTVYFWNPGCTLFDWVATFTGTLYDIPVTVAGSPLGPRGSASTALWTAYRIQADAAAAARAPAATAATLRPWARDSLATFLASVPGHIEMTPGAFPWRTAVLCTTCGRFTGDQRITQGFQIT